MTRITLKIAGQLRLIVAKAGGKGNQKGVTPGGVTPI
jgi:hypothetical protein